MKFSSVCLVAAAQLAFTAFAVSASKCDRFAIVGFNRISPRKFSKVFLDDYSTMDIELSGSTSDGELDLLNGISSTQSGDTNQPNSVALKGSKIFFQTEDNNSGSKARLYSVDIDSPVGGSLIAADINLAASATIVNDCYVYVDQNTNQVYRVCDLSACTIDDNAGVLTPGADCVAKEERLCKLGNSVGFGDIVYDPDDNLVYGQGNQNPGLWFRFTYTGVVTPVGGDAGTGSCVDYLTLDAGVPRPFQLAEGPGDVIYAHDIDNNQKLFEIEKTGTNPNFPYDLSAVTSPAGQEVAQLDVELTDMAGFIVVKGAGTCGDPHYTTWHGENYDYHGQCDLELLSDPTFAGGKGLTVHTRTEIVRQWSYIKSAAIKIGDDILEVTGGADEQRYWFNKEYQGELGLIGGFPITYKKSNSKSHSYVIHLDANDSNRDIEIRTYKDFVRVDFGHPTKELYGNSVGLLGDYHTGKKLGRDGVTVFTDNYNDFGQEWQVMPDSPVLFATLEGPQAPSQQCILPAELHAEEKRRRLGEKLVSKFDAEVACRMSGIEESQHEMCVKDVLAADDLDMAGIYLDSSSPGSF